MTDAVMGPVFAIPIVGDLISAEVLAPWIRIIIGIRGVATIMLGMIMLFSLAYNKQLKI